MRKIWRALVVEEREGKASFLSSINLENVIQIDDSKYDLPLKMGEVEAVENSSERYPWYY